MFVFEVGSLPEYVASLDFKEGDLMWLDNTLVKFKGVKENSILFSYNALDIIYPAFKDDIYEIKRFNMNDYLTMAKIDSEKMRGIIGTGVEKGDLIFFNYYTYYNKPVQGIFDCISINEFYKSLAPSVELHQLRYFNGCNFILSLGRVDNFKVLKKNLNQEVLTGLC